MSDQAYEAAVAKANRALEGAAANDARLPAVARWLVDEIWAAAERETRAKVAAEIRAACDCATQSDPGLLATCEFGAAARIAEGSTDG